MKTHCNKCKLIIAAAILAPLAFATSALASLKIDELSQNDAKAVIQDPSTIKIPSNAHAADAGNGILFNWDSKQKDNTVVTVTADAGVKTSFTIIVQSSGKYFIGQVNITGSDSVTIDKPGKDINMVYIADLQVVPSKAAIRYYAICQLWNDLMWGADGYGLSSAYNNALTAEQKAEMYPVGVDHRTALQIWWGLPVGDQDVRYIPVKSMATDFADKWADIILNDDEYGLSLKQACDLLGIDVEAFIANYDTAGFLTRNNLW